tara:strand:- start:54 stop:512 length:459 start_codon:yes stop_codon:yes gene_type:complete
MFGSRSFMKAVVQRVDSASVSMQGATIGSISQGLLVFIGVQNSDGLKEVSKLSDKLLNLRIFNDKNSKMNLSLADINGELLIISQFTLFANCTKGNRPSFINAGNPIHAKKIYNEFVNYMNQKKINVQSGEFGADMKIELINSGPATFILDI